MSSTERQLASDALNRRYAEDLARRETELVFTSPDAAVKFLHAKSSSDPKLKIPSVGVDMLVIAKEMFHGGWNLWLANKSLYPISPDLIKQILSMDIRSRGEGAFRLSVWNGNRASTNYVDPETIPLGSEIIAENVTGLKLYLDQVAQGNTSRVTVVPHGPSSADLNHSSDSNGSDDDQAIVDAIEKGPKTLKKRPYKMIRHLHLSDSETSDEPTTALAGVDRLNSRIAMAAARKEIPSLTKSANVKAKVKEGAYSTLQHGHTSDSDSDTSCRIVDDVPRVPPKRQASTKRRVTAKPRAKAGAKSKAPVQTVGEPDPEEPDKSLGQATKPPTTRKRRKL